RGLVGEGQGHSAAAGVGRRGRGEGRRGRTFNGRGCRQRTDDRRCVVLHGDGLAGGAGIAAGIGRRPGALHRVLLRAGTLRRHIGEGQGHGAAAAVGCRGRGEGRRGGAVNGCGRREGRESRRL